MAGGGGCGHEVQLAKGGGRDPLFPVGAVQPGSPEGALSGGAERGVVACDFGLQAPSLIPAPPQVAPGRAPLPTSGGALRRHWRGRQAIWTSLPPALASPRAQGPREGMECEMAGHTGLGGGSCSGRLPKCAHDWGCPRLAPQLLVPLC